MPTFNHLPPHLRDRFTLYAGRDEWLAARIERTAAGAIGSTTASGLLGLSPWATPWEVWARVHAPERLAPDDGPPARILERGLAMEPLIASLYTQETGAQSYGSAEYMTATHPGEVITTSPDAIVVDGDLIGIGEWKFAAPWTKDEYPSDFLEIATLEDLDASAIRGRWPAKRQYIVQAMCHLIASGLDFCDLFIVFGQDVKLGHPVEGWDSHVAVEGTSRLRLTRDAATLTTVGQAIMAAHARYIVGGEEPEDGRQPALWGDRSDPLSGKRDAEGAEVEALAELADAKREADAMAARVKRLRADLRDSIEASGKAGIRTETSEGGKVSATISKKGTLTIRGI
jgi:hypothetical protein